MAQIIHNYLGGTKDPVAAAVAALGNFQNDLIRLGGIVAHGNRRMPMGIEWTANSGQPTYPIVMKAKQQQQTLTLGKLIESVCSVYGQRRASGIIRRAMANHVVVFREEHDGLALLHRRFAH